MSIDPFAEDPYLDPASGVLRNHLGITDPQRLRQAEAGLSFAALADLGTRRLPGGCDLAHLLRSTGRSSATCTRGPGRSAP